MKRLRVTLTAEYLIPNSWEIVNSDATSKCLRGSGQSFLPDLCWMRAGDGILVGDPPVRRPTWISVDDDRENWFIERLRTIDFTAEVL